MDHHILGFFCFLFVIIFKDGSCQEIEDENICQKHPGNLIIANPHDCFSFYACQYGNAMKIICPNNSMFNPQLGNCDPSYTDCRIEEEDATLNDNAHKEELLSEDMQHDDDEVGATDSVNTSNTDTATTELSSPTTFPFSSSTTNLPANTTAVTSTVSPEENSCETCPKPITPNVRCPSIDTEVPSFLASDLFCDSFFICYHGKPFEMFCPVGFYWSQTEGKCVLERESNCTDSFVGNKIPKCPLNGQFFIPHIERCNLFYYCENGIRSIQQCSAFKQWDVIEQTCKLDINAKCITTIPRSQRANYYTL